MWYAMLGIFCQKSASFSCFLGILDGGIENYLIIAPAQVASEFQVNRKRNDYEQ